MGRWSGSALRAFALSVSALRASAVALAAFVSLWPCAVALGQTNGKPPAMSDDAARALVAHAVDLNLAQARAHAPVRFQVRRADAHHETVKQVIETRDGDVARLVALDGKPLSADAEAAERARLDNLLAHPDLQAKRLRREQDDAARVSRLTALLPRAFLFHLEGTEPCSAGAAADSCLALTFKPDPKFNPPEFEANVFRSVAGRMRIDRAHGWIRLMDAHFITEADLGFGLVAKIDKGGTARLEQTTTGLAVNGEPGWALSRLDLHLSGHIMIFKSLEIVLHQELDHFAPVPAMGYADAIRLLESEPAH